MSERAPAAELAVVRRPNQSVNDVRQLRRLFGLALIQVVIMSCVSSAESPPHPTSTRLSSMTPTSATLASPTGSAPPPSNTLSITQPASAIPLSADATASCPVSEPNATRVVLGISRQFGYQSMDGTLITELWPEGRVIFRPGIRGHIHPDGSIEIKWPWFRTIEGVIVVEGRRLDAEAPPMPQVILRGRPDGYGETGIHPSTLIFPSEGCWEVTASVGETTLTLVTLVMLDKE